MYREILVPLDGSERAEAVLPHVEELARRCSATVTLLRVVAQPTVASGIVGSSLEEAQYQQELRHRKEKATSYLATLQRKFLKKGVDVKARLGEGPIAAAIVREAEREGADLIALASRGRTGLSRIFFGSVAASVRHRSDRPLLVIRTRTPRAKTTPARAEGATTSSVRG